MKKKCQREIRPTNKGQRQPPGRQNQMDTRRNISLDLNGNRSTPQKKFFIQVNNFTGRYESPGKKLRLERFNSAVRFSVHGLCWILIHRKFIKYQKISDHKDTDIISKGSQ